MVVPIRIAEAYQEKLIPLLQLFSTIHWLDLPNGTGFVGTQWTHVDIEFTRRSAALALGLRNGDQGPDGVLAEFAACCRPQQIIATLASAGEIMHDAIGDLLYQACNNVPAGSVIDD